MRVSRCRLAFKNGDAIRMRVLVIGRMMLDLRFAPLCQVEFGHKRVTRRLGIHGREIEPVRDRQCGAKQFRTADHEYLVVIGCSRERVVDRMHHNRAGHSVAALACDDDRRAPGSRRPIDSYVRRPMTMW